MPGWLPGFYLGNQMHRRLVGEPAWRTRNMKKTIWTLSWLTASAITATVNGQVTTTYEDAPDGTKYLVTRQVTQRSIPTTEYQPREQKVYRPQVTTEYQ